MRIGSHDTAERVFIVAEIGNNHEGDMALAERMIVEAAAAGVDAVKFQTLRAATLVGRGDPDRIRALERFELSPDQFASLAGAAEREGVLFLSTPFDLRSVEFLAPLVPAFKVASGDITFLPLLDAVATTGKPVFFSRGNAASTMMRAAMDRLRSGWDRLGADPGLAVLHCVSMYPTPSEEANLAAIPALAEALGVTVGYSDHTLGVEAAPLAVALGARIVEKHFTLDHDLSEYRDHALSADPVQMRELVRLVRLAEAMRGGGGLVPSEAEAMCEAAMRRSLCAARDLPRGTVLAWEHMAWLRPGGGLPPGSEDRVLGRVLARAVERGEPLAEDMFVPLGYSRE